MNKAAAMNNNNYSHEPQQIAAPHVPKIRVVVRKRPLTSKEIKKTDNDIVECHNGSQLVIKELK